MTARLPGDRPVAVVGAYLYAVIRDKDFDTVRALLADDVIYENVLPEYARRPAHREDLPSDHRAKGGLGRQNPSDRERGYAACSRSTTVGSLCGVTTSTSTTC
jgi:hypothetical protein